jgi:hypothetical protein
MRTLYHKSGSVVRKHNDDRRPKLWRISVTHHTLEISRNRFPTRAKGVGIVDNIVASPEDKTRTQSNQM